jgi:hypothetical protein
MLTKCANPNCHEPFRYLHKGKLFLLKVCRNEGSEKPEMASRREHLEYFWLCTRCSGAMSVFVNDSGDVVLSDVPGTRPTVVLRPAA